MHVTGWICGALNLILAGVAVYMTTATLQVRNSWQQQVEKQRETYRKTIPELEATEKKLQTLQTEWQRVSYGWLPVYGVDVDIVPNGQDQIVLNNMGPTSGLQVGHVVHVMSPAAGGQMIYTGPFKVTEVQQTRSVASANWALTAGQKASWPAPFQLGRGCRVYGGVPTASVDALLKTSQLLVLKDEQLAATESLTKVRDREVQIATEQRSFRESELHGDPGLVNDRGVLPRWAVDGLVLAIEEADEARNVTVTEVDDLRHQIKRTYDEVQRLEQENRSLVQSLPAGDANAASAPTAAGE